MRFHAEHSFHGSPAAVMALLADPTFYLTLRLPDLSQPVVLRTDEGGGISGLRLRYEFVGRIDPVVRRILGPTRLAWVQQLRLDGPAGTGTLSFEAEASPKRLHGSARFVVTAAGDGAIRSLDGDFVVAVPVIGGRAEQQVRPGLLRRLDIEAEELDRRMRPATGPDSRPVPETD